MKLTRTLAGTALALLAATAFAQTTAPAPSPTATPRIDARRTGQAQRIDQGVASGQLTARETNRLDKEQQHIAVAEAKDKADGKVTPKERAQLTRMQNKASRDIRRQKHDAQTAKPPKA